jgi:paired small multidrug resistance pump
VNRYWIFLLFAALFEIGWVTGLKHASAPLIWMGTVIAVLASFFLLYEAMKKLPVGTAYAVFAGMGTGGTVFVETVFFDEPLGIVRITLIGLVLIGVIGLKMITTGEEIKESP